MVAADESKNAHDSINGWVKLRIETSMTGKMEAPLIKIAKARGEVDLCEEIK